MKASLFSFVAAAALFATTAAAAAPINHDRDLRRMSPRERARYEQSQRERARFEQAQRERERQQAIERARWEAAHRYDRGPARPYGHR
jgi:Ni/Co efflux regulator RcnB